jgi:peptidoglycan/LPS O-acetylase OafA/YrhL
VHYTLLIKPWLAGSELRGIAAAIGSVGNTGVDLFFVLSGYLIYRLLLARRTGYLAFVRRRIERIYPAFASVLLLYLLLSWAVPAENKLPLEPLAATRCVLENFLLLPGIFPLSLIISVAWSLSYEFLFYLTVPVVIAVLTLRRWPTTYRVALWCVLLAAALATPAVSGYLRITMFFWGILLADLPAVGGRRTWTLLGIGGLLGAVVSTLLFDQSDAPASWRYVVLGASLACLCEAAFTRATPLRQLFSCTPLRWLGNISYSYYLVHGLTLKFLFAALALVLPPTGGAAFMLPALLVPAFLVTLVPSITLYLLIEKPLSLDRSRRNVRAPQGNPPPGESASHAPSQIVGAGT